MDFLNSANPKLIAEISANHGGDLDRLLDLVNRIADAGAHAVKLQTFVPDEMTINANKSEFTILDPASPWYGRRLYDLYEQGQTPRSWHKPVFELAKKRGMVAFSSVFGLRSLEFLESLEVPIYKIASFENIDLLLLREVAKTRKPVFMSTGMITLQELTVSIDTLLENGTEKLVLFGCTSSYPANPSQVNLGAISFLKSTFGVEVGYSDHTLGISIAIAAVASGAKYVEKHVKSPDDNISLDSSFALDTNALSTLVASLEEVDLAMRPRKFGPAQAELSARKRRRGLFFSVFMEAGETITIDKVQSARPMIGVSAIDIDQIIGRKVKYNVEQGEPITFHCLL